MFDRKAPPVKIKCFESVKRCSPGIIEETPLGVVCPQNRKKYACSPNLDNLCSVCGEFELNWFCGFPAVAALALLWSSLHDCVLHVAVAFNGSCNLDHVQGKAAPISAAAVAGATALHAASNTISIVARRAAFLWFVNHSLLLSNLGCCKSEYNRQVDPFNYLEDLAKC